MELQGATKDADCSKVDVNGGVSSALGCCNEFQPEDASTSQFSCGTCEYKHAQGDEQSDTSGMERQGISPDHPLQQLRAKPKGMGL